GHAFKVSDWLILQGQPVQVVEITWRSTRFRNNDDVSFNVPNSQLAKETIVNLCFPTRLHAVRLRVTVDATAPPNFVKDALVTCTAAVPGVHPAPAPAAYLTAFDESGITYELKFWIDDDRLYQRIMDAVRTNCWYEFDRRRIAFSVPVRLLGRSRPKNTERNGLIVNLLSAQPLFALLSADQIQLLAAEARWMRFGRGETIIRQGSPGDSMFILGAGTAHVFSERDGRELRVGELQSGDCFGELSFLTGDPRSATVNACEDCEVVEIPKHAMGVLLRQQPALAEALSETLVQRQNAIQKHFARAEAGSRIPLGAEEKEGLLRRLRAFFEL
ncbi:MAG TPA: cyclic nucleotide-binding domain-containing protein, partial [Chthoniobacterales bacterium]